MSNTERNWPFLIPDRVTEQVMPQAGLTLQQQEGNVNEVTVSGYACKYGEPFEVFSMPGYKFMRLQEAGSFKRSLGQNPKVMLRLNHQAAFASTHAGTLTLEERKDGLYYSGTVSRANPEGQSLIVEMERGTLDESSVAYMIRKQTEEIEELDDGSIVMTQVVKEADINRGDVSVVQFGMNPRTKSWIGQAQALQLAANHDIADIVSQQLGVSVLPEKAEESPEITEESTEEPEELRQVNTKELELLELKLTLLN